jgi:hypothetical protein
VVRELLASARKLGIRIRAYLDDWLLLASDLARCQRDTRRVLELAERLGFGVNVDKSELIPSQRFRYLGMDIDSRSWLRRPSEARIQRLVAKLSSLRASSAASARALAALLGQFESLAPLVPLGGVFKRPLQREFLDRGAQASS